MLENVLKKSIIIYICLTLVEYGLTALGGSLLKIFGYVLIFLWILLKKGMIPNLKKNKALLYMIAFLGCSLATLLWSVDVEMGSYYFLAMANMVFIVIIASTLSWNKKDMDQLLTFFQFAAGIFSLIIVVQGETFGSFSRATLSIGGTMEDPNNMAAMLLIPTIISVWKILNNEGIKLFSTRIVLLNFVLLGLPVTAMLMLGSRGALISAMAGTLFLLLFNNQYSQGSQTSFKTLTIFKTLIIIAAVIVIVIPYIDADILQRLTISRMEEDKGSNRLVIWGMAISEFFKAPLFGIGLGSFQAITQKGVHNQFLIVLVETGIVGFILFTGSLVILLRKTLKNKLGLLAAVLIATMVVIFFLDSYNKKFLWNAVLISIIILRYHTCRLRKKPQVSIEKYEYSNLQ
jgi:O-antigen ligase